MNELNYVIALIDAILETKTKSEEIELLDSVINHCTELKGYIDYKITIEELDLNVRACNCLKRAGIYSVDELINHTRTDLYKVRNLGANTLRHIEQKLALNGLKLKEEEEE